MKEIKLLLFLLLPISSSAQVESAIFKIKVAEEIVAYQFSSVKDFEENYEKYLDDFEIKEDKKKKKIMESFWVEISILIKDEKQSTAITRSINSNENALKEDIIKLKKYVFSLLTVL